MSQLSQHYMSGHALAAVRIAEAKAGHTVAQHYQPFTRFPQLLGTFPRRHKRDRAAERRQRRWVALCRFFGQPLVGGDYALGI